MFYWIFFFCENVAIALSQATIEQSCRGDANKECTIQTNQEHIQYLNSNTRELNRNMVLYKTRDCYDILKLGNHLSGVYEIYTGYISREDTRHVYCDLETDGGGWTVFQRRQDGSVDFARNWEEYKQGFGNLNGEHWLGNSVLHGLTSHRNYDLRIDVSDWENEKRHAIFSLFHTGSELEEFQMTFLAYVYENSSLPDNGDDGFLHHKNMRFSTYDNDNDAHNDRNCAEHQGGFWYKACQTVSLNSYYGTSSTDHSPFANWKRIRWDAWHGKYYSLKSTQMMIRPRN